MSRCDQCGKEFDVDFGIMVSADADFVCSKSCQSKYEKEKEEFFNNIHDDEWYNKWIGVY